MFSANDGGSYFQDAQVIALKFRPACKYFIFTFYILEASSVSTRVHYGQLTSVIVSIVCLLFC